MSARASDPELTKPAANLHPASVSLLLLFQLTSPATSAQNFAPPLVPFKIEHNFSYVPINNKPCRSWKGLLLTTRVVNGLSYALINAKSFFWRKMGLHFQELGQAGEWKKEMLLSGSGQGEKQDWEEDSFQEQEIRQ